MSGVLLLQEYLKIDIFFNYEKIVARMFKNIFKIKPISFLGIDLGTASLRVAELKWKGKDLWLENYGEAFSARPENFVKNLEKGALLSSGEAIADDIKKICEKAKISTKDASIAVPDFSSFYTSFDLPAMAREEIVQAIQYEVRPHIPLPLSEITLDWVLTEGRPPKTPLKVLVVAIPNNIISQYKKIAELAGLNLKTLEPEVFSLTRALIGKEDKEKNVGLIDIGARSTTCNIVQKGTLKISHSFKVGGNELTGMLAKSLNIGYNEAEKIKREEGIKKENKTVRDALILLVDSILEEIKKVFRDYYRREGKEIDKIILFGSPALLPGLKEHFVEQTKKETILGDPFQNILYPEALKKLSEKRKMALAIPIGLAIKELKGDNN